MARLPLIKRILKEDLPESPDWTTRLLYPLNLFFENVYNALDGNITFGDNIESQTKEVTFQTSSAYDGTQANFDVIQFPNGLKRSPNGMLLLQITQVEDAFTSITTAPYVNWLSVNQVINIYLITGLTASKSYKLRVLLI